MQHPTDAQWQALYALADEFFTLAPWKWIGEHDIFGVQHPDFDEIGFIHVQGSVGPEQAVGLYPGWRSLSRLQTSLEFSPVFESPIIRNIPHLLMLWVDPLDLSEMDLEIVERIDRPAMSGKMPIFRSLQPSMVPWYISREEAHFLQLGLEQLLALAPRLQEDPTLIGDPTEAPLVMSYRDGEWQLQYSQHPHPEDKLVVEYALDDEQVEAAKKLRRARVYVEADLFELTVPVYDEESDRPFFMWSLLLVDANSGEPIAVENLRPLQGGLQGIYSRVPPTFLNMIRKLRRRPREIRIYPYSDLDYLLGPLCQELEILIIKRHDLPMLEDARDSLEAFLSEYED